jgi:hypothetical protein
VEDERAENITCKKEMGNSFTVGEPEGMGDFNIYIYIYIYIYIF